MFEKPQQGLPRATEFGDFVEDERNGVLNTPIGIFLDPVTDLEEADRGSDDKLAATGLLIAC